MKGVSHLISESSMIVVTFETPTLMKDGDASKLAVVLGKLEWEASKVSVGMQ